LSGCAHNTTVLIGGRNRYRKEVIARAITSSALAGTPKSGKMNCAAYPRGLLESELFGHERGAFYGRRELHVGRFALGRSRQRCSSMKIGDLPLELQPKLLRVLQEREFEAVGSMRTRGRLSRRRCDNQD